MNLKIKALKAAFPYTIPVFAGYSFLGIAFGILMQSKGLGLGWTVLMSVFIFAGSMQYVSINLLTSAFNPLGALILTLIVNARHIFYGLSMLDKYKNVGNFKPYLIFGLTDETFSVLVSTNAPKGVNSNWFKFFVTILDQTYWVLGTAVGAILGKFITLNTKGLDFVLTALFVVIFIGQWKGQKNHNAAIIGVLSTSLCLLIFGKNNFVIPSMIMIFAVLTMLRNKLSKEAN